MKRLKKAKKRLISWLLVIMMVLSLMPVSSPMEKVEAASTGNRIVGYFPSYRTYAMNSIDFSALTHCMLSFMTYSNGTLTSGFSEGDVNTIVSRCHANGTKVMIAIGGWNGFNASDDPFGTPEKRTAFVNQVMNYVNTYNLDGVDIDIELTDACIWNNYDALISELSGRLKSQGKLLTMAVSTWFTGSISNSTYQYFDFLNLMSYDYNQQGTGDSAPWSQIYDMVAYYGSRGVSNDKLVIGVPFYGWGPGGTAYTYAEMVARNPAYADLDYADGVYYNGKSTIRQKAEYSKSYGGTMIWEVAQDTFDGNSLLKVIKEVMGSSSSAGGNQEQIEYKSVANGDYYLTCANENKIVTAPNSGADPLAATKDSYAGASEKLTLVNNGDGTVSLKSAANGKYICAVIDESSQLLARSAEIQDWEKFYLVKVNGNDTQCALKSVANGMYVSADFNNGGVLKAMSGTIAGSWEAFTLTTAPTDATTEAATTEETTEENKQPGDNIGGNLEQDSTLAVPFGLVAESNANNTIGIVWGNNEIAGATYNVYVNGELALSQVGCAYHTIANVTAGTHTVAVSLVLNSKESNRTEIGVTVAGEDLPNGIGSNGNNVNAQNQAAANAVIDKINQIGTVTLDSEAAIESARAAYEALTAEQKSLVTNYTALETAEDRLAQLVEEKEEQEEQQRQEEANQAAANTVSNSITQIGNVTLDSKSAIESARAAYEALTAEQKSLVTNYADLVAAESTLAQLEQEKAEEEAAIARDKAAAQVVIEAIAAIGSVTLNSEESLEDARAAYEALTDSQKAYVGNYNVLEQAEIEYDKLREEFEQAEEEKANQIAANAVVNGISQIGQVTLESKAAIEGVRAAYEALTAEQKRLVTNYSNLVEAENTLTKLEEEKAEEEAAIAKDKAAAKIVVDAIAAIGNVSLESEETIENIRKAYEALTDKQKAYVENYDLLERAEEELETLQKKNEDLTTEEEDATTEEKEEATTEEKEDVTTEEKEDSTTEEKEEATTEEKEDVTTEEKEDSTTEEKEEATTEEKEEATTEEKEDATTEEKEDSTTEEKEEATTEEKEEATTEEKEDATTEEKEDATTEEKEEATTEEKEEATTEEKEDATTEEKEDATTEEKGDATTEENKNQTPDNNTQTSGTNNNQDTGNTNNQTPGTSAPSVQIGDIFEIKGLCYQITKIDGKNSTVTLTKANNKSIKKLTVSKTVKYNGVTYKVTAITDKAFQNCKKLKTVVIGKNVTTIGKSAFKGCKNLKTVTIKSKTLSKVGSKAFSGIKSSAKIKCGSNKLMKKYKKLLRNKVPKNVKIVK